MVREDEAREYDDLVRLVQEHAEIGSYIYAAPNSPEVYFLAAMRNPTGTMYEMFDDPQGRSERILHSIEANNVRVISIKKTLAGGSAQIAGELMHVLEQRFPQSNVVGQFEVRWR